MVKRKRTPKRAEERRAAATEKKAGSRRIPERDYIATAVDILALLSCMVFLLSYFNPNLLLLETTINGGDTCSHNYLAGYMRDYLLPHGKLFGWSPGWWAGFPMFQYYFFMPYLMTALLSYFIPLEIAFKLISVLGVFTLPLATYLSLRMMKLPFPTPAISSVLSLLFLFHERQTIWGMNVASMLAGEISVSISFSAMVLFLGLIYKNIQEGRFTLLSPMLFAFVVFTHMTTALVAGLSTLFLLLTLNRERFIRNASILVKTYGLAFLFTAFWTVSLISKIEYSVGFGEEWRIQPLSLYPPEGWAAIAFSLYAVAAAAWRREKAVLYLFSTVLASVFFFFSAYNLNLVNIRFWPFHYYYIFTLGAYGLVAFMQNAASLAEKALGGRWIETLLLRVLPLVVVVCVVLYLNKSITFTKSWIVGNYEGFESKMAWKNYSDVLKLLDGTPGRMANDLSGKNVPIGSSRVFEAVPYFIDKNVIEGGIVQSGLSSLFTYYIQCESSTHCAGFPRIMTPTSFNLEHANEHMKLYNVKYYVAVEDKVKNAFRNDSEWRFVGGSGEHEVYELTTNNGNYVYVPEYYPVLTGKKDWEFLAMRWYQDVRNLDAPIALADEFTREEEKHFKSVYPDNRIIWSTLINSQPEFMGEWLTCGVFPNPRTTPWTPENSADSRLDYGLNISYIDEKNATPVEGEECGGGRKWVKHYAQGAGFVDLSTVYEPENEFVVAYAATYAYSPTDRVVDFLYGSDDGLKMWLNGELVHENHIHRGTIGVTDTVELNLKAGWNLILLDVENVVSGWGVYAKLVDKNGDMMSDIYTRVSPEVGKTLVNLRENRVERQDCVIEESMENEEITFNTTCPGMPHIVKVSYFPNWKVEGAKKVYLVTPDFMLVYPEGRNVKLYYGHTTGDVAGMLLTAVGLLIAILHFIRWGKHEDQPGKRR